MGAALSSAPSLSRRAQPSYASIPALCHGHERCQGTKPLHLRPARAHIQHWQLSGSRLVWTCWQPVPLLSSRGQGCRPGPEEQFLLLQLLPPLTLPARREPLLLPGVCWAPVFYLLCFSCMGPSAMWQQPHGLL